MRIHHHAVNERIGEAFLVRKHLLKVGQRSSGLQLYLKVQLGRRLPNSGVEDQWEPTELDRLRANGSSNLFMIKDRFLGQACLR